MLRKKKKYNSCSLPALKHLPEPQQLCWLLSDADEQNRAEKRQENVQKAGITCVQMWPWKWHLQAIFFSRKL